MSTISLSMIVKNEAKTLERCLRSVEGIPDEIIIIDTGSEDNTKEIARNFTPQIFDFEWADDFSAARNYSFEQVTMIRRSNCLLSPVLESKRINVDASLLALHELAKCYQLTGNLDKEWECTLRSLEFDVPRPEFSCRFAERFLLAHKQQGLCYYRIGDYERSLQHNKLARQYLPHDQGGARSAGGD
jgi:glycosyltransferase involved in cell wall biosynthesis